MNLLCTIYYSPRCCCLAVPDATALIQRCEASKPARIRNRLRSRWEGPVSYIHVQVTGAPGWWAHRGGGPIEGAAKQSRGLSSRGQNKVSSQTKYEMNPSALR